MFDVVKGMVDNLHVMTLFIDLPLIICGHHCYKGGGGSMGMVNAFLGGPETQRNTNFVI